MLVVAVSVSAMATKTASVRINLAGSNATYSVNTLRLVEDDARSAAAESGYDVSCMMSQANENSTLIYGLIGTAEYSTIYTNDLTNLEIGFVTNQVDQDYTLTFSNFSGNEFVLYDKVANKTITINATTPVYAFSVDASLVGRKAINDRFVIGAPAPAAPSICFNMNKLEVKGYAGKNLKVMKGTDVVIAEAPVADDDETYDLSAQTGRLVVTLDGKDYQIDANPAVTVVP